MTLEQAVSEMKRMIMEVTEKNYPEYYGRFTQVILRYRENGGMGKPLSDQLYELWKANQGDDWKTEVIQDAASQMIGFCIRSSYIKFPDSGSFESRWSPYPE